MRKSKELSTEEIQEACWRYEKGASVNTLCQKLNIPFYTLRKALTDHGVTIRLSPEKKKLKFVAYLDPIDGPVKPPIRYKDYLKKAGYKS